MEITTKQLRIQPGRIISQVNNGQEITITYRGKACAKIIPINTKQNINNIEETDNELFGMWKDRKDMENVEQYVRNMRREKVMLIDSDVLIWYIRGDKNARNAINNNMPFKISVINYMEIIQGMKDKRELKSLQKYFKNGL